MVKGSGDSRPKKNNAKKIQKQAQKKQEESAAKKSNKTSSGVPRKKGKSFTKPAAVLDKTKPKAPNNWTSGKKAPVPLTQKDRKKYRTHKVAVVFNEEERREYMAGFYGAKKRRKEEYLEKKKEKQKEAFKEHRKTAKKIKQGQIERYRQIIEQNNKELDNLQFGTGFQKAKTEVISTANDTEVEVVTEFL